MRFQLSMYASSGVSAQLEDLRLLLDPIQSSLIPAHVTLCREEELTTPVLHELRSRLEHARMEQLTLVFGRAEPFGEHGILLPCIHGESQFQALREHVLGRRPLQHQTPHLTLAHPRNPKAPGNDIAHTALLPSEIRIHFNNVRLIEQLDKGPWRVMEMFTLAGH